jgi:hypothetical protein
MATAHERLRAQVEALAKGYGELLAAHNNLVGLHNRLVSRHNENYDAVCESLLVLGTWMARPWWKRIFKKMPEIIIKPKEKEDVKKEQDAVGGPEVSGGERRSDAGGGPGDSRGQDKGESGGEGGQDVGTASPEKSGADS